MLARPLPEAVQQTLGAMLALIDQRLPGLLAGFYLIGSLALDGYDERLSDIDYLAVLSRPLTPLELGRLAQVHREVKQAYPRAGLSGSYLPAADLGGTAAQVAPHPYYQDGRLVFAGHFELNPVTWWILKQHGITLRGPAAGELSFSVDQEALLAYNAELLRLQTQAALTPGREPCTMAVPPMMMKMHRSVPRSVQEPPLVGGE